MRSLYALPLLLTAVLWLGACQQDADRFAAHESLNEVAVVEQEQAASDDALARTAQPVALPDPAAPGRRAPMLIRRADLALRVTDYDEAAKAVPPIVGRFDAYLAGEQEVRHAFRISNTYTIRVAAAQFDSLLTALGTLAEAVERRSISVDDVTEEFVDLEARLSARRAVEARYVELLARANSVEDVLAVQRSLAEVREEIERAEGRRRFLQDRAAMSTVTLTLFEESPAGLASGPSFLRRLSDAFAGGWDLLLGVVVGAVTLWPLWLLVALAVLMRRVWRRRSSPASPGLSASHPAKSV